jgi:hypothetical protein
VTGREPVHPRAEDVFTVESQSGLTVAVDRAGCIVVHAEHPGAYTITNVDELVGDLTLARVEQRRYLADPEGYRRAEQ